MVNSKEEGSSRATYQTELNKIKAITDDPKTSIELLNDLFKDFARKKYHVKKTMEYTEMAQYFKEKSKPQIARFCEKMLEILYSGEQIDKAKTEVYIDEFEKILQMEYLEEIKKKSKKEISFSTLLSSVKNKKHRKSTNFVGKTTKKEIDEEYIKHIKSPEEDKEKNKYSLYEVIPKNEYSIDSSKVENHEVEKFISNIDDLDRIKHKIKQKSQTD